MQIPDLASVLANGGFPTIVIGTALYLGRLFFRNGYRLRIDLGPSTEPRVTRTVSESHKQEAREV